MKVYVTDPHASSDTARLEEEPDTSKCNSKGFIRVPLPSSPFADLAVTVYYWEDPVFHTYSNIDVKMKQVGWGIPGLTIDKVMFIRVENVVEFHIDFTLLVDMPAADLLPLPGKFNDGTVHGHYDLRFRKGAAAVTDNDEHKEISHGGHDPSREMHPR